MILCVNGILTTDYDLKGWISFKIAGLCISGRIGAPCCPLNASSQNRTFQLSICKSKKKSTGLFPFAYPESKGI
jgi:hypothetical protein